MTMTTRTRLIALFLAVVLVLSFTGCKQDEASDPTTDTQEATETNGEGRTDLNVRIKDGFSTFDPHNYVYNPDIIACANIYETLYNLDVDFNEIPVLATGYTVSEDGLTAVFTIEDEIYFSNGEKLTVEDVKFSYERMLKSAYLGTLFDFIESVTADAENNTVTLNLTAPTPTLIQKVAGIYIVNKKFTEENQDDSGLLGYNSCGTGPYVVKEYKLDESFTLATNPDYRDGEAAIKTINFILINDSTTVYNAIKSGEIDVALLINTPNWEDLKADPNLSTIEQQYNHSTYMVLNTQAEPTNNKLVRQAIACALNREDVITMALEGRADKSYAMPTSLMFGYLEVESEFSYDPERAKALLAEAGYPDGVDIGEIQTLAGSYFEIVAEVVQQQLAEVGITSTIFAGESNTVINNAFTGNFTLLTMGQSNAFEIGHLSAYYGAEYIGGMNMAQYSNAKVEELLADAAVCMDSEERDAMYKEVLDIVDDECAYVFLANTLQCTAWSSDLNFEPNVLDSSFYEVSWK